MIRWFPAVLLLAACAQLDGPTISVDGGHAVQLGQTLQLSATTSGGRGDPAYTWTSDDSTVAAVDATGLVTGNAAGETTLTIKGTTTQLLARHLMVVFVGIAPLSDGGMPDAGTSDGGFTDAGFDSSQVPYYLAWSTSPHADIESLAFNHWDAQGSVPVTCARCHSSEGFIDYLGGDGSAAGRVDAPGKIRSTIRCETCHDASAIALTAVTFPSGVTVSGLGPEARCMVCHQGRASGLDVDHQIADAGVADDVESPALGFSDIHYFPAAATLFAGQVKGGYQYADQTYDTKFRHVPHYDTCVGCHEPHSTKVKWAECATCHPGVVDATTAHDIRQIASKNQDYNGDGNRTQGIYYEVQGLADLLLTAMQRYGAEKNERLCYSPAYPNWFNDTDGDGTCGATESVEANGYKHWTPRLERAAYNFQMAKVDGGNFAHNAKYTIQLLHDAVESVNAALTAPLDLSKLVRNDPGHFDGASQAARHWDAEEHVDASCSRCHGGAPGYRFFTMYGVGEVVPQTPNGLECYTCHDTFAPDYVVAIPPVVYLPDSTTVALPGNDNLCANCHIGRESKTTVDKAIAKGGPLSFINLHYLAAAGTREGTLTKIGYEYTGKTYAGRLSHMGGVQCTSCHDPVLSNHTFQIADVFGQKCQLCHADQTSADQIRLVHLLDYDGDGQTSETLQAELDGMAARLLTAMRSMTANGICYSIDAYPYFFKDTNADGICAATETVSANAYGPFTPALLEAAFNYQLSRKDPGAWAHNFDYVGQLLFDSVENLTGVTPTNMTRP